MNELRARVISQEKDIYKIQSGTARLFDRFYTVETARSSTGLGLPLVTVHRGNALKAAD